MFLSMRHFYPVDLNLVGQIRSNSFVNKLVQLKSSNGAWDRSSKPTIDVGACVCMCEKLEFLSSSTQIGVEPNRSALSN